MKKLYIAFSLFLASLAYSQVPQAFRYQTIAFNSAGAPIANGNVNLRISILDNSATGNVLYTETHTKTTNSKGLVNLNIGQGTATTGNFGGINWGTNPKFVKVEMDPAGGSNYTNVGVNQLMSVPYSQVSKTVVTGPGQGITLVSPNGTSYELNVNDSGQLSLPTSNSSSTTPSNLYLYGSFNNWSTTSSIEFGKNIQPFGSGFNGFIYLKSGDQIKFLADQTGNVILGSSDGLSGYLTQNGSAIKIPSNGYYSISVSQSNYYQISPINISYGGVTMNYDYTNYTSTNFNYKNTYPTTINNSIKLGIYTFGDNLNDGSLDYNGSDIYTPTSNVLKTKINFNGSGTYQTVKTFTPPATLYTKVYYTDGTVGNQSITMSSSSNIFTGYFTTTNPAVIYFTDSYTGNGTIQYGGQNNILTFASQGFINVPEPGNYFVKLDFNTSSYIVQKQ